LETEPEHDHDHQHDLNDFVEAIDIKERQISPDQQHKFEGYAAEILAALGMDMNTQVPSTPPPFYPGVDRCHRGIRWGSQADQNIPDGMSRRAGLSFEPGN